MPRSTSRISWVIGCRVLVASAAMPHAAAASGPDVVLYGCEGVSQGTASFLGGPLNGQLSYSIESRACNVGTSPFLWNKTPGYAQNLYRLHNGRLMQIGQSWVKYANEAFTQNGCGTCPTANTFSPQISPGCIDVYTAGFNGQPMRLGPRSGINAFSGTFGDIPPGNFDRLSRRIVVPVSDITGTYASAKFFFEGVYVSTDDALAHNAANNASYRRATFSQSSYDATLQDTLQSGQPAITAWVANDTSGATIAADTIDVVNEGRFHYLYRVLDLGNGSWRYDYAVFNLNSDVSGGSFSVPLPTGVTPTNVGFHDVDYHSGEIYDNTDWTVYIAPGLIKWSSPQPYAENPNSNALRWGTMYNFWFELAAPPTAEDSGCVELGLFKPFTPDRVQMAAVVPMSSNICPNVIPPCLADFNDVNGVTVQDIFDFLTAWLAGNASADFNAVNGVTVQDIFDFLTAWLAGC